MTDGVYKFIPDSTGAERDIEAGALPTDDDDDNLAQLRMTEKLTQASKVIIPLFAMIGLVSLCAMVLGLTGVTNFDGFIWVILVANLLGGIIGATGVYLWGTVMEQIEKFRKENTKYESHLVNLRSARQRLSVEVTDVCEGVHTLRTSAKLLETQIHHFDALRKSLEEIADKNSDLSAMIDSVNGVFEDTRKGILMNKNAALLNVYYDVTFRDEREGLSKGEWRRLLGRLTDDEKQLLTKLGSFEELSGADGLIDLREFQQLVSQVIDDLQQELDKHGMAAAKMTYAIE